MKTEKLAINAKLRRSAYRYTDYTVILGVRQESVTAVGGKRDSVAILYSECAELSCIEVNDAHVSDRQAVTSVTVPKFVTGWVQSCRPQAESKPLKGYRITGHQLGRHTWHVHMLEVLHIALAKDIDA